jgi:hypothetical protein
MKYKVSSTPDHDVVARHLTVKAGDVVVVDKSYGYDEEMAFEVPQDAACKLTLVDVDDGGNASPEASLEFVALDTIPPGAPGAIGLVLVGERADDPVTDPVPDPVPEPEPTPEPAPEPEPVPVEDPVPDVDPAPEPEPTPEEPIV